MSAAFAALSSVAELEDVDRMAMWLSDPSARNRCSALRGMVRAKAPQADGCLNRALADPSSLVVRIALKLLSKEGLRMSRRDFEACYFAAPNDRVRRQLIRGSRLLGKWDELQFLVPLLSIPDGWAAGEQVDRWLLRANRRFTPLDPETKMHLRSQLDGVPMECRDRRWEKLDQLLRQS